MTKQEQRDWPTWMTPTVRKKIDERVDIYLNGFGKFRAALYQSNGGHASGLAMNAAILREVVERYFEDLEKDRLENRCGLFNGYRQAAFTMKWLMRLRPIQTVTSIPLFIHANEDFALYLALVHLSCDPEKIDPLFRKFFLYTLRFNQLDEGLLMSLCVLLNPSLQQGSDTA